MILAALPIFTGTYAGCRATPADARWIAGCVIALLGECALIAFRAGSGGPSRPCRRPVGPAFRTAGRAGYVAGAR